MRRVELGKSKGAPKAVDPIAWKNRLLEACSIYTDPPVFKVGDILTHNPALYPKGSVEAAYSHGVAPLVVVIEIDPSWRTMNTPDRCADMPMDCQAILIGQFDQEGMFITSWYASVFFIIAPDDLLRPAGAVPNLNH